MPRIPDKTALGDPDSLRSGRSIPHPVAEAGGEGAMGMAIGRGLKSLGDKLEVAAESHQRDEDALDLIRAESHYKTNMLAQEQKYDTDPDYKTYGDRHALESGAITDDASNMIRNARLREKWRLQKAPETESSRNRVLDKGLRIQRQEQAVEIEKAIGQHATIFADINVDDATRDKALQDMDASVEAARRTGLLQPKAAATLLKKARERAINDYTINLQNSDREDKYDRARDAVKYQRRPMPQGMEDEDTPQAPRSGPLPPGPLRSGERLAPIGTPGTVSAVTHQDKRAFTPSGYGATMTGTITLNGNTYEFINGGRRRGSIPFGSYAIGRYTSASQRAAEGKSLRVDSFELSDTPDDAPRASKEDDRRGLLIHSAIGGLTAGCIGIKGDFEAFKRDLAAERARNGGRLTLQLGGRPSFDQQQGGGVASDLTERVSPKEFFGPDVDVAKLPLGMRVSNNPGNIKFSGSAFQRREFQGLVGPSSAKDQGDPQAEFANPLAGMTAAVKLARLKQSEHGLDTVGKLIADKRQGWTPGYAEAASNIAKTMGVGVNDRIDLSDDDTARRFMRALITQEHGEAGKLYSDDLIANGVRLASGAAGASAAPDHETISARYKQATGQDLPVSLLQPSPDAQSPGRGGAARRAPAATASVTVDLKGLSEEQRHVAMQSVASAGFNTFSLDGDTLRADKGRKPEWQSKTAVPQWAQDTMNRLVTSNPIRTSDILRGTQQRAMLERINAAERRELEGAVKDDLARVSRGEEPLRDSRGRTALERIQAFDTSKRAAPLVAKMREAEQTYKAIAPLGTMTDAEANEHLSNLTPGEGGSEASYAAAVRIQKKAEEAWKAVDNLRTADPATLVDPRRENVLSKQGITKRAPEVTEAYREIQELTRKQTPGIVLKHTEDGDFEIVTEDPSASGAQMATSDVTRKAQELRGKLVEARLAAQQRIGVEPYRQRAITKQEADRLFGVANVSAVSEDQLRRALKTAADKIEHDYGPDNARRIMADMLFHVRSGQATKMAHDEGIVAKLIRGETVRSDEWRRAEDMRRLDAIGRIFEPSVAPMLPTAPSISIGAERGMIDRGARSGAALGASQNAPPAPNVKQQQWLRDNPQAWRVFDDRFGQGTAARILSGGGTP